MGKTSVGLACRPGTSVQSIEDVETEVFCHVASMQLTGDLPVVVTAITTPVVPTISSPAAATAAKGFFHMSGPLSRARGRPARHRRAYGGPTGTVAPYVRQPRGTCRSPRHDTKTRSDRCS